LRISVNTNKVADSVKVTDFDGNILKEITEYDEDTQGRYFMVEVLPEDIGEITLKVYAGVNGVYSPETKSVTVNVIDNSSKLQIANIRTSPSTVYKGDDVELIFNASKEVKRIVVEDSSGKKVREIKNSSERYTDYNMWETWFYAENKTGTSKYTIVAYDDDDNKETATFEITVKDKNDSNNNNSSSSTKPVIDRVVYDERIDSNTRNQFKVTTNDRVVKVEIRDNRDDRVFDYTNYSRDGSYRVFEFSTYIDESGTYYVYVYDNDDNYDYQRIEIEVR